MNEAIGDVFLIYRCPACDELHDHHVGPLDPDFVCAGLALSTAWVFERAQGARECATLVTLDPDGRPHALAVTREGDRLRGTLAAIPEHLTRHLTPAAAFALARREGQPLLSFRADDEGAALLVGCALARVRGQRTDLNRLLREVEI